MEISLRNIEKSFSGVAVLSNLNLLIKNGEILVLSGENGSGKTTLLRIISFLTLPNNGKIYYKIENNVFEYKSPYKPIREVILKISYLHQKNIILKGNVEYNIKIGKILRGEDNFEDTFYNLIERFGICDILKKDIYEISEGQRRIVCLLRCISVKYDMLILDEPFTNLDSNYIEILKSFLNEEKNKKKSIIMATPGLKILADLHVDKILQLGKDGKIN